MYAYLEGKVASKSQNELVLDVCGVGYLLNCSAATLADAPPAGDNMRAYTWLSVKEDALELVGFSSMEEKQMFMRLTSVSGVGPRTALAVLGSMPLRELTLAIVMGDVPTLSRAPGIGKKMAQRIALELKEKVSQSDLEGMPEAGAQKSVQAQDAVGEAIEALQALGYTASEAARAVTKVQTQSDQPDELIRLALRNMAGM